MKNNYYLFNYLTIEIFKIDFNTFIFLKILNKYNDIKKTKDEILKNSFISENTLNQIINEFKKLSNTKNKNPSNFKIDKNYPIRNISLNVTQKCNLNCIYCYGEGGSYGNPKNMSFKVAKKAIDFFISKLNERSRFNISFFGGEPLINYKLIKKIIYYCKEISNNRKIKITYDMTTNGTLLNSEKLNFLLDNNVHIMISMDGPKEIQDRNRPLKNKGSSYDLMIKNVKNLINKKERVSVRSTVVSNIKIKHIIKELTKIGFKSIYCSPVTTNIENWFSLKNKDINNLKNDLKDIAFDIIKKKEKSDFKYFSGFRNNIEDLEYSLFKKFPCGAGRGLVAIDVDGIIYLCHRFVGNSEFIIGDIFNGFNNKREKYFIPTIEKNKKCKNCWAKYLCGGLCYHENYIKNNNEFKPHKDSCDFFKETILQSLIIYINYKEKELNKENIN